MKILSIETSCDETSIALIEKISTNRYKVLSHETISQMNLHREWGGVYPTLSRREHEKNLVPLLHKVLQDSNMITTKDVIQGGHDETLNLLGTDIELLERYPDLKENFFDFFKKFDVQKIDYIAVTNGPGLPPALWVGVNFAKCLSTVLGNVPLYPINHMEGHIVGAVSRRDEDIILLSELKYPVLGLLISGGHTEIVLSNTSGKYEKVGETQDDAVGEAYDKVARMLGLPYPGGPEIGKLAKKGREQNVEPLNFPRPMLHSKDLNFSFSGIKTHILYFTQKQENLNEELKVKIATEFEEAVKDVLIYKVKKAINDFSANTLVVGGGVASNEYLRNCFESLMKDFSLEVLVSEKILATDNALMIALTCANQIQNGKLPTKEFLAIGSKNYEWES